MTSFTTHIGDNLPKNLSTNQTASLTQHTTDHASIVAISAIKQLSQAKSRLTAPALTPQLRQELVLAMLHDTHQIFESIITDHYIISPDQNVLYFSQEIGCMTIVEENSQESSLNHALEFALNQVQASHPQSRIILIQPDLPAISLADIQKLLQLTPHVPIGIISDSTGTGTTLLSFAPQQRIKLQFGPHSAQKHQALGAQQLSGPWDGLQNDIDTFQDLLELFSRFGQHSRIVIEKIAAHDPHFLHSTRVS